MNSERSKSPNNNNSISKSGDGNSLRMDVDDVQSNSKKSEKSSNVQIKDVSTFITQENQQSINKSISEQQYLIDFAKFLNKKQFEKQKHQDQDIADVIKYNSPDEEQKHNQKPHNRQERIQNELKKRLKLISKSKEAKFNDMLGVFKKLDTFIDIKPFLHDLNTVNNSRMYNTIQELKQRVAEKKNQEEVDVMLEQVKQKIQKQEKEQEEENKILSRGMKDFVQKTQLLKDSSKYVMEWRKNHNINQGIMSEQLIDHYRNKNNNYQTLVDQNHPDIDAYQFYDQLSKQLFQKKSLFQKKPDFPSIDTRRESIVLRQEELVQKQQEEEIQQMDKNGKKKRLSNEEEELTEEEKLRLAQESIKSKLLTIDGFEKENQDFSDQRYFESFQDKAQNIRKNLQKATEATFKKKWANSNVKLKKIREDDYRKVMKQIQEAKQTKFDNLQFPSRASFKITFQGKEVESQVAKMIKSTQKEQKEDLEGGRRKSKITQSFQNSMYQDLKSKLNNQFSRSNSNHSKESNLHKQFYYKSSRMASDISQYDDKLFQDDDENEEENSNSDESKSDSDQSEHKYYSKKWKQIQNDNRLSQRNSVSNSAVNKHQFERQHSKYNTSPQDSRSNSLNASPQKQVQRAFFTQTSRHINEIQPTNKSHFHIPNSQSSQSIVLNNQLLQQNGKNQSFNQIAQLSTKAIHNAPSYTNQYFFPSSDKSTNNNSIQNNKSSLYFKPKQSLNSITERRNTDFKIRTLQGNSHSGLQDQSKSFSKSHQIINFSKTARNGVHPSLKQNLQNNPKEQQKLNGSESISDQNDIYSNFDSVGLHNPPSTPSARQLNISGSQYSKDLLRKQTESYQALEKHLLSIKFQKFLKGIDNHQLKFGVTRERYQSKINQIQKKFENEITKFEPPVLDIYQSIELQVIYFTNQYFIKVYFIQISNRDEDRNHKYTKGKMISHRNLANTLS